jgi:hypothetical protein
VAVTKKIVLIRVVGAKQKNATAYKGLVHPSTVPRRPCLLYRDTSLGSKVRTLAAGPIRVSSMLMPSYTLHLIRLTLPELSYSLLLVYKSSTLCAYTEGTREQLEKIALNNEFYLQFML